VACYRVKPYLTLDFEVFQYSNVRATVEAVFQLVKKSVPFARREVILGNGGIHMGSLIYNLGNKWVFSFTLRTSYHRRENPLFLLKTTMMDTTVNMFIVEK
jgi:hypothetical protein